MPTSDQVHQKFGFTAEAAQLLETELGNLLLIAGVVDANLIENPDTNHAAGLLRHVNEQTLGRLLKNLHRSTDLLMTLESELSDALVERNRLFHSFYREHNFRINSDEGRELMLQDLESIHFKIFNAYKVVMCLTGVDLDKAANGTFPTGHIPI